jgi:AcrR family transcriptional regulator
MKSSVKKRLRGPERRTLILAAALAEFARSGYEGASMDAIAVASGISKPVLYDHFPSKQHMFGAVLETVREQLLAQGSEAALLPEDDEHRFRTAIAGFFSFVKDNPDAIKVLLLVPYGAHESLEASRAVQKGASAGIAKFLTPLLRGQTPQDIEVAAEFLKRGLHALAEWWLGHPEVSITHMIELGVALSWSGIGSLELKESGQVASRRRPK